MFKKLFEDFRFVDVVAEWFNSFWNKFLSLRTQQLVVSAVVSASAVVRAVLNQWIRKLVPSESANSLINTAFSCVFEGPAQNFSIEFGRKGRGCSFGPNSGANAKNWLWVRLVLTTAQ